MRVYASDTIATMWKSLCHEFEGKSHVVSIDLHKWMLELQAKDGDNICAHLNTLHYMHKQLAGMNTMPTPDDYSTTILISLPATYTEHLFSLTAMA